MSEPRSEREPHQPKKGGLPSIAEESRERWPAEHPDAKEAGDDGPHRSEPEEAPPDRGNGATDAGAA